MHDMSKLIGLIYPPFELRATIDKTASFVAKNGEEFESRILSESDNLKFAFINKDNPFHLYYKKRLEDFKNGVVLEDTGPTIPKAIIDINNRRERQNNAESEILMLTSFEGSFGFMGGILLEPEEPRRNQYTIVHPLISEKDEAVIKITAMYLARNGQKFLSELVNREANNPQFDFLKPGHILFNYFADLVEAYSLCLIPNKEYLREMKIDTGNLQNIFRRCYKNNLWRVKEIGNQTSLLSIENDFIDLDWITVNIVETVDFEQEELSSLPEPIDFSKLSKVILEKSLDNLKEEDRQELLERDDFSQQEIKIVTVDKTQELKEKNEEAIDISIINAFEDEDDQFKNIKIVKDYVRRPRKRHCNANDHLDLKDKMYRCQITGQLIPVSEISSHMKILLLDPKWKQQKDQLLKRAQQETAFTASTNIEENLAAFVSKRPDLFGTIEEVVTSNIEVNSSYLNNEDRKENNKLLKLE